MAKPKAKATPHWVVYNAKQEPVKCMGGAQAVVRAKAEIERLEGYSLRQMDKSVCPLCFPPKPTEETGHAPISVTLPGAPEGPKVRPGQCPDCLESATGMYKLKIIQHTLVRVCKLCGGMYDIDHEKPWEG